MKSRYSLLSVTLILNLAALASCGGGGGGGGGGGSAATGVRVLHASIDASPVNIVVNDGTTSNVVVERGKFGFATNYGALGNGPQTLAMTRTLTPSVVVGQSSVTVNSGERRSFLIYGDNQTFGLRTNIFLDNPGAFSEGSGKVRVINGVTGAAGLTVGLDSSSLGSVSFGDALDYTSVSAGAHRFVLRRASDGASVGSAGVTIESGRAYTILAAGEIGYFVKVLFVADDD